MLESCQLNARHYASRRLEVVAVRSSISASRTAPSPSRLMHTGADVSDGPPSTRAALDQHATSKRDRERLPLPSMPGSDGTFGVNGPWWPNGARCIDAHGNHRGRWL